MAMKHKRNDKLVDAWSLVHFATSAFLAWWLGPIAALLLTTAWEPFEIFVLSPLLAKRGIVFGYETWRNSLSDVFFNVAGILVIVNL